MGVSQQLLMSLCIIVAVTSKIVRQSDSAKAELEEYIANKRTEISPRFRLHYHVIPPVGWMNDPNGFSFYKGEYHLFYQFYPYDSKWGPMHWGHFTSPNLVEWKELPTALLPEEEMCFSGSAVVDGDDLVLMYTARLESEPVINETQYLAYSNDGINFVKYEGNPVIKSAPNGSPDFRDPKVWKHEDHWYTVIGSKTDDLNRGAVFLYRSRDLKSWEFLSTIGEGQGNMGYMWECPDFFELDGKFILLMSPQGMEPEGDRYKNVHQNGYIIGRFDYETFQFVPEVGFQEIDFGHDFYAAQTMEKDGKRYVVAWFSSWDIEYPEAVDGWAGALTIIRELRLVGNRILQKPVESMVTLREQARNETLATNGVIEFEQTGEIIFNVALNQKLELLIEGKEGGEKAWLKWDPATGKVSVDRGSNDIRQVEWTPIGSQFWRIFLDACSMELFCGEGEVVFSSRVYPTGNWKVTNLGQQTLEIETYHLRKSIIDLEPNGVSGLGVSFCLLFLTLMLIL